MTRIGEDVGEKLEIVPAQFFVHRHIHGKWACHCGLQVQESAAPEIIDGGVKHHASYTRVLHSARRLKRVLAGA